MSNPTSKVWDAALQGQLETLWIQVHGDGAAARDEIAGALRDRGFAMVRGLDAGAGADAAAFKRAYRRFGDALGTVVPQAPGKVKEAPSPVAIDAALCDFRALLIAKPSSSL